MKKYLYYSGDAESPEFKRIIEELDLHEDPVQGFVCNDSAVAVYNFDGRINGQDFGHLVDVYIFV